MVQPVATPLPPNSSQPSSQLSSTQPAPSPASAGPKLPPALQAVTIALLIVAILTGSVHAFLGAWSLRYLDRLAPEGEDEVIKGLHLTRAALQQPDHLVAMGSSELTFQDEFHAARLFNDRPTGFALFAVGAGYRQSIHNFLVLSALGRELEGRRIVLFISPTWFHKDISDKAYKKNYSALQAYEFVESDALSPELKQRAARRLLALGAPATEDQLLRNALEAQAGPSVMGSLKTAAAAPFFQLGRAHLQFKDRWDLARLVVRKNLQPGPRWRHSEPLDWTKLEARAEETFRQHAGKNRFDMNHDFYRRHVEPRLAQLEGAAAGETWLHSSEYSDLQLVLDALRELKAEPLFISLPIMGQYDDFKGHARADREQYYAKVRAQVEAAGFPLADLSGHEYEPGYHNDPWHQGWKGSVHIARILDDFYHGRLPEARR